MVTGPLTKGCRSGPHIDGHVKHLARSHSHQFALGVLGLKMQTTQHVFGRTAVIVLHESDIKACDCFEILLVKAFKEKAPLIPKHFWGKQQNVRYRRGLNGVRHG